VEKDNVIIREVREIRHRIAESCGNDIRRIIEHANAEAVRLGFAKAAHPV